MGEINKKTNDSFKAHIMSFYKNKLCSLSAYLIIALSTSHALANESYDNITKNAKEQIKNESFREQLIKNESSVMACKNEKLGRDYEIIYNNFDNYFNAIISGLVNSQDSGQAEFLIRQVQNMATNIIINKKSELSFKNFCIDRAVQAKNFYPYKVDPF